MNAPTYYEIGGVEGAYPELYLSIPQTIGGGSYVIIEVAGFPQPIRVSDTGGNTYSLVAGDSTASGGVAIFASQILSTLIDGDDNFIIDFGDGTVPGGGAVWGIVAQNINLLDQSASGHFDGTQAASSLTVATAPISSSAELVVGVMETACTSPATLVMDGGLNEAAQDNGFSGVASFDVLSATGLSGSQQLDGTVSGASNCEMSGAIAAFYKGQAAAPTNLSLSHVDNTQSLTVSWTGGHGNGGVNGCMLEYQDIDNSLHPFARVDCDQTVSNLPVSLPSTDGWVQTWASPRGVDLVRWDHNIQGYFSQALGCTPRAGSPTPTPTIDENCNGIWDDSVCTSVDWVLEQVLSPSFNACWYSNCTSSVACTPQTVDNYRYTPGQGTSQDPSAAYSCQEASTGCAGPDPDGGPPGAVEWMCLPTNCTYD